MCALANRCRRLGVAVLLAVIWSCGGDDGSGGGDGGGGAGSGGGDGGDAGAPAALCDAPEPLDVSSPTAVVGDGTAASCTAAALRSAASAGGVIVFSCGEAPVTIEIDETIVVTEETVIDGGGLVTLDGGGQRRILYLDSGYDTPTPRLTVQGLTFRGGRAPAEGEDTAQGGGAIYRDGGSLTVIDSVFEGNRAPETGQDVAGGAIYGFGGGDIVVAGSSFTGNTASDGGAIGSLNGDLTIVNSRFVGNAATGFGGNPGNGGAGGALYMDGGDEATSLCGVVIADNSAGAIGGGVFRVSNDGSGSFSMERSTVDGNEVTPADSGNAGGLYLQGLDLRITASTISRNRAFYGGGMWINGGQVEMVNSTIADNVATGSNGGGLWLGNEPSGTLRNVTIASNHATAEGQIAGAIFGEGLTLENTLIAGNTAMYTPGCSQTRAGGSGNLQWPDGALCAAGALVADPLVGELGDHGGDTETVVPAAASPVTGLGADCPPTDQLGNPRPSPCSAGAVEPALSRALAPSRPRAGAD